jgi:hypothetical protein
VLIASLIGPILVEGASQPNLWAIVAGSTVIAALVGGIVSLHISARNIQVQSVTSERAKWRDKIREKALGAQRAIRDRQPEKLAEVYTEFVLSLNPQDPEDQGILTVLRTLPTPGSESGTTEELVGRLSLLLKHDWERAKWESSSFFRWPLCHSKRRVRYDEFRPGLDQLEPGPRQTR